MSDVRPRVISVRHGHVVASGSWLYVWVDVADRSIAYVGATGFDPELRAYVHVTSDDPGVGRVRAGVARFDERDFDVLAFALPADCPRPAAKQALVTRLAELECFEAPTDADVEAMPAIVEPIVTALRDHLAAMPVS